MARRIVGISQPDDQPHAHGDGERARRVRKHHESLKQERDGPCDRGPREPGRASAAGRAPADEPNQPTRPRRERDHGRLRAAVARQREGRRDERRDARRVDRVDLAVASSRDEIRFEIAKRGDEVRIVVIVLDAQVAVAQQALRDGQVMRLVAAGHARARGPCRGDGHERRQAAASQAEDRGEPVAAAGDAAGEGVASRSAAPAASAIGAHAIGPVQMSATAGNGTGHHGIVDTSAGSASRGSRRNPGTSSAPSSPSAKCHHGAGTTRRGLAEGGRDGEVPARAPHGHARRSRDRRKDAGVVLRSAKHSGVIRGQLRTRSRLRRWSAACSVSSFLQKQNRTFVRPAADRGRSCCPARSRRRSRSPGAARTSRHPGNRTPRCPS